MKVLVLREPWTEQGTFGKLRILDERELEWDCIELPWRDNAPRISCIPAATFHAKLVDSAHFERKVYLFDGIPGRSAVEMHPANWAGDVGAGWHSDLLGCIALGMSRGTMTPPDKKRPQECVLNSKLALEQFIEATGGEDIEASFHWNVQEA